MPGRKKTREKEAARASEAREENARGGNNLTLDLGDPNPKQLLFLNSRKKYTAYGGARGGGKTHILIRNAIKGALEYSGIKILIMRRTYPELETTIIQPLVQLVNQTTDGAGRPAGDRIATYNATQRTLSFVNGSTIRFGHLQSSGAITEYQGQEYDWIFMDEATHFTEWEFRTLGACLRGVNKIPKRFYLTCNPGGVGHMWVKRLFVSREYTKDEDPNDYLFIPATVEDNKPLLEHSPDYVQMLDLLPDDIRRAHRYGDWDAMAGQYFTEFKRETHVVKPFTLPDEWPRYRCFDYGLDMFACYWFAVDFEGRCWFYREYCESGLVVSDAAAAMRMLTPAGERIEYTVAPPDMWSTQKDTGRTMAEVFTQNGIGLVRANNSRIQGWLIMKEYMKVQSDGKPRMLVFDVCDRLVRDVQSIQHDDKNPSDCAKEPHDITHTCDAIRYGLIFRTMKAERLSSAPSRFDEDETGEEYDDAMCGGEVSTGYLSYGG